MDRDLDIKTLQEFVEKNPELPIIRVMRNEILSTLARLDSVQDISLSGDVAAQAIGKKIAYESLNELFDRLGFGVKKSPPNKSQSFR